jgi:hypothetical protein
MRVSQKEKEHFKTHIYCKYSYTETKLILLFDVIPPYFKAPIPAVHNFFNSVRKKFFFFAASLTSFALRHFFRANRHRR